MDTTQPSPFEIGRLMMSLWVPQAVHAAAELGVADAMASGLVSPSAIASAVDAHPEATRRLLDALVVLGLISRAQDEYRLTALGEFLRSDTSSSRRAWARLMGGDKVWRAWGELTRCVRTGAPAFGGAEASAETDVFDVLAADPEAAAVFHRAMADGTKSVAGSIVAAVDRGPARTVLDVGGGWGALLAAFLEAHPELRGSVFDLPQARAGAEALFAEYNLGRRASFVAGDLFREPPPVADLMLLKSVIHDWDDARGVQILRRCRQAMAPETRLVIIEPVAAGPGEPVPDEFAWIVSFSDLNMLVNTGGKERTVAEYEALVEQAGLRVVETRATGAFYTCFVCVTV